ncbi:hypothetical protein OESDEN_18200, partial [Oesophagostomum dentatum]
LVFNFTRFRDSEFSTVSPSETTNTEKSALPSPRPDQSTPFRRPTGTSTSASSECSETGDSSAAESPVSPPSSPLIHGTDYQVSLKPH